tara:strand:- start:1945 stop:2430 length:486 start_codon:yes stop_codon:yes gene_type:complete
MDSTERLSYKVMGHAMLVLLIGLLSGIGLIFSLLDAVTLWPLPAWEVSIPGSTRGWQAAHVGGILNGVMIAGVAVLMTKLSLTGKRALWVGWGMIITGWANTVFYWAGNFSQNRGLSVAETPYGPGDIWGALAFLGGGAGMVFTIVAAVMLAMAAFEKARS